MAFGFRDGMSPSWCLPNLFRHPMQLWWEPECNFAIPLRATVQAVAGVLHNFCWNQGSYLSRSRCDFLPLGVLRLFVTNEVIAMSISPADGQKNLLSSVVKSQSTKVAALFLLGTFLGLQAYGQYTPPPPPPPTADQAAPAGMPPGPPQGAPQGAPPMLPPQQLDPLVGRIALYPDPLLAQVLTASCIQSFAEKAC